MNDGDSKGFRRPGRAFLLATVLFGAGAANASPEPAGQSLSFASGERQVVLLELYTSEGCSSCPPADRWMSRLVDDPDLWRTVVPVSFHVDYWDWIGWRDRFADSSYSQRQRRYVREGGATAVYTPGFFANGAEWRGFFAGAPLEAARPRAGVLELAVADGRVTARFEALRPPSERYSLTVAVLGTGLSSGVAAGENRGKTLRHDFVVLGLTTGPMSEEGGAHLATATLPDTEIQAGAIAAWVTESDSQRPVQAVGGALR